MSAAPAPIVDRISAGLVVGLALLVVARLIFGIEAAFVPSILVFLALIGSVMPRYGVREWVLLGLSGLLGAGVLASPAGLLALEAALGQAAYFSAFIVLLMLLREGALTSPAVLAVGDWLTRRPPGQRFVTMWIGAHLAGILMNFGAVSLLAPLVQRGVRARPITTEAEEQRARTRERRQINALIRGFAMVICWAPTTLTQVIIFAAVPGLDVARAIGIGLGMSALMLVIGWVEDRWTWGRARLPAEPAERFPWAAGRDLVVVYALLVVGSAAVMASVDAITLPQALMAVTPLMLLAWLVSQNRGQGVARAVAGRLGTIFGIGIPRMAKEATLLGMAGFIGISAARLAPVDLIAHWIEAAALPPWVVVACLPVVITLGGQIALSPMMIVVFLGAVIGALPVMPAPPEAIAIGLGVGWALSMTASPNATGALLLAGATGLPSTTLTWRWNGRYSLIALGAFAGLALVLVG